MLAKDQLHTILRIENKNERQKQLDSLYEHALSDKNFKNQCAAASLQDTWKTVWQQCENGLRPQDNITPFALCYGHYCYQQYTATVKEYYFDEAFYHGNLRAIIDSNAGDRRELLEAEQIQEKLIEDALKDCIFAHELHGTIGWVILAKTHAVIATHHHKITRDATKVLEHLEKMKAVFGHAKDAIEHSSAEITNAKLLCPAKFNMDVNLPYTAETIDTLQSIYLDRGVFKAYLDAANTASTPAMAAR